MLSFGGVETLLTNRHTLSAEANGKLFRHIWKGVVDGKLSIGQVVHDVHARARHENTEQSEAAADGLDSLGAFQLLSTLVIGLPCSRIE